ncbi:alpha/beta-hydrolase [Aaosphaeria arxii CBS 175.79]|uniref:Carboxylic ester hydrolase n=1 Tax=Aaosphaeria arxii CBS 175.79 TaxID=1450172 RepID=A0A6A5XVX8_9PLEO|nr:alpha/beta-hydrolase [Aaosphaeria arxii CBS 175.79]KAF2016404.1 alpha/beta-hydrolase [Aaosphaeria arxii CBS 175.79]
MDLLLGAVALQSFLTGVNAGPLPRKYAREAPVVDLGYSVYEGVYDADSNINSFKGIRYAAPPLGNKRWAAPSAPETNRTTTIPATEYPPVCPQTGASSETPPEYGFASKLGNEDCLFLNVFAPADAHDLPVFFWIHGGGYALFSSTGLDASEFITTNNNGFVAVVIQYRLGAFGFLAGEDVKQDGVLNAGLLDMNYALKWVQNYIGQFGGDPSRVTIAGESAGGAAVLYQAMAYGGKQEEDLFENIISASPWLPHQYDYNDDVTEKIYDDFAGAAGCSAADDTLRCLREAKSEVLQNASGKVSEAGPFGTFAFVPVTDSTFVQHRPTEQLISKNLRGRRILTGSNANDGIPLSPPTSSTLQAFRDYVDITFPLFSDADKGALEKQYSYEGDDQDTNAENPLFDTSGTSFPTAVNQSSFATGQQQRLFNLFSEYAFHCPSYWIASSFPQAWKYQLSALPAFHGFDLNALWSKDQKIPGQDFIHAFQKIWGNFIINNNPVISVADAKQSKDNATVPAGTDGNIEWPQYSESSPTLLSLNTTGGVPTYLTPAANLKYYVYSDPGVTNAFKVADAAQWEGGRGNRCDWWKVNAAKVPY